MSLGTCVAGCLCVVLGAGVGVASAAPVDALAAATGGGLRVDRLSRGDLRIWRAIEAVVADSDPSGVPRSPTLRRLWDWAHDSTHVLHVEMVPPSRLAAGMAGVFRVESSDPAGRRHVAVIRLCPSNIQRGKAAPG